MAVGIELEPRTVPVAPPEPPADAPPPAGGRTRRALLRSVFTLGVVTATTAALAPIVNAGRRLTGAGPRRTEPAAGAVIDEMYQGRQITVVFETPEVRIDGRPLHVMRRADGSYLSVVNHYESFPTLLETARAAVDDLRGARLSLSGPMTHHSRPPEHSDI
ncbi:MULTISPECIES: tyrosinase family oxidase copper chaperone [unclassified Streptomyces]|uniref:tyrosinase family oxidase copper chaperone n=1 Tax=unclassified Streptomyces TaxID=2593676 RepID=UPI0005A9FCAB|nr:tyrosinase family oxidase copper chaperone [Streptomyces sp. NBC_00370]